MSNSLILLGERISRNEKFNPKIRVLQKTASAEYIYESYNMIYHYALKFFNDLLVKNTIERYTRSKSKTVAKIRDQYYQV